MKKFKLTIMFIIFILFFNYTVCFAVSDVPIVEGKDKDKDNFSENSIHHVVVEYLYDHELYQRVVRR